MKKLLHSFMGGIRTATSSAKLVLMLYIINVLVALPLALVFRQIIDSTIGDSLSLERFGHGFDFSSYSDFLHAAGDRISTLTSAIKWVVFLYMLLTTFLGGGVLGLLNSADRGFRLSSFFELCGKYFLRFARLFIFFGLVLVVVFTVSTPILEEFYDSVDTNAVSEVGVFYARLGVWAVTLFLVGLVVLISDYARIEAVQSNSRSMVRVAWRAVKFVFRRFPSAIGLQLVMSVLTICIIAVYLLVENSMFGSTLPGVVALLLLQQLTVLARTWTRVATFGGERTLYLSYVPTQAVEPSAVRAIVAVAPPQPEPTSVVSLSTHPPGKLRAPRRSGRKPGRREIVHRQKTQARRTRK